MLIAIKFEKDGLRKREKENCGHEQLKHTKGIEDHFVVAYAKKAQSA